MNCFTLFSESAAVEVMEFRSVDEDEIFVLMGMKECSSMKDQQLAKSVWVRTNQPTNG